MARSPKGSWVTWALAASSVVLGSLASVAPGRRPARARAAVKRNRSRRAGIEIRLKHDRVSETALEARPVPAPIKFFNRSDRNLLSHRPRLRGIIRHLVLFVTRQRKQA